MEMEKVLESFPDHGILVLGDVFIDEYLNGDCSRISPEAPVPILKVDSARQVLGGAANTAANIASLGGRAILVGLIGDDHAGRDFRRIADAAGIDFRPVMDGRPTTKKTRLVGHRQQLIRLDCEETHYVGGSVEDEILRLFADSLPACSVVVLSDYAKGFLTAALCKTIIAEAHRHGKKVIVDPRPQHAAFYRHADYLTPNWKEALGLLGLAESRPDRALFRDLTARISAEFDANVLLTLGPDGMSFYGKESRESFVMPTEAREVFDVSGAGDTVVASFALALASGLAHQEAAALANKAAGVVVGKFGTATVCREEILKYGEEPGRLIPEAGLATWVRQWKAKGKRIAVAIGRFESLSPDLVRRLEEARGRHDMLIVGVSAENGPDRMPGEAVSDGAVSRAGMLMALRCVDVACILSRGDTEAWLADHADNVVFAAGERERKAQPMQPELVRSAA